MSKIVHFEIHARDPSRMQKFYEEVFGWNFVAMGPRVGNYRIIVSGNDPIGANGDMSSTSENIPIDAKSVNPFINIVGVEDIVATMNKIKSAGGAVTEVTLDVPMVGTLAYCKDTEGNLFGIIQPLIQPFELR